MQDDGGPVCGNKAVQLSATSAEKKAAMELVQQFRQTSFSGKELPSNQESNKFKNKKNLARIDLQKTFYNSETKKRWMNFQIQLNQQRSKGGPTTIAHLFLEANRTYPIEAIRQGFNESLAKCAKVWLEFSPQSVPEDFKFRKPGKKWNAKWKQEYKGRK